MPKKPKFELRVKEVRCLDLNDGFLNGDTDRVYLWDHLSGISDGRAHDLGKFKKGTKRSYKNGGKLVMEPKYESSFSLVMLEKDLGNVSGDDRLGGFSVSAAGKVKPGKTTKNVTPASAPKNQTVLSMTGSGGKYKITLALRAAAATTP